MNASSTISRLPLLAVILASAVVAACGGSTSSDPGGGTPPTAPVISSFTATPSTITGGSGSASTLAWTVTGATSLSIAPGVGTATGSSIGVSPAATMTYTLTATNAGGSTSATATVTVSSSTAPVASVAVTLAATTLTPGQTTQATHVLRDAASNILTGRSVTWSSASNSIASVDQAGLVTATGIGTATITATSEGKSGSADVTVSNVSVANVTVALAPSTIGVGQTSQASAVTRDAAGNVLTGRTVTWTSSSSSVATVDSGGSVTAIGVGIATITATSETKSGAASVAVQEPKQLNVPYVARTGMTVNLASFTKVDSGTYYTHTATYIQTNNTTARIDEGQLELYFSNRSSMPQYGFFSTLMPGQSTTRSYSFQVLYAEIPTVLEYDDVFMPAPSPGTTLQWTIPIPGSSAPVSTVAVALSSRKLPPVGTTQATATLRDVNGNVLTDRSVTWASSDTAVATVSEAGLVTAVAVGSATISATCEGQSGSDLVTMELPQSDLSSPQVLSIDFSPSTVTPDLLT